MNTFIEQYDNSLDQTTCEKIIKWFEESTELQIQGECGNHEVRKEIKDSTDIALDLNQQWYPSRFIFPALGKGFVDYTTKYNFLEKIDTFTNEVGYNIQRYYPDQGYFIEHCEHMDGDSKRVLAWTIYLNDVHDGGGTAFPTYDMEVQAKAGRLVIFPAYWTHSHMGVVSKTETKYIATGWFSFR